MKKTFILAVSLMIITGVLPLPAAVLKDISIDGRLKKTREKTVRQIIRYEEGDEIQPGDEETVRQRLIESGLFVSEDIKVDLGIDGEEAYLSLFLRDRFSLVPIPVYASGDGNPRGGLFLMDQNLFGTGNQFFFGGMFGETFRYTSLSYTDTKFAGSDWDLNGRFAWSANEDIITSIDGDEDLMAYDRTTLLGGAGARWNGEPWFINLGMDVGASDYEFLDDWVVFYQPELGAGYRKLHFGRFMSEGFMANAGYAYTRYSKDFDDSHTLSAGAVGQKLLGDRFQLALSGSGYSFEGEDIHSPGPSSAVIPEKVRALRNIQAGVQLNTVLWNFSWAYIALPLSYQLGYMDGVSADDELYHGPAAGLTLNLKKVAIPAVVLMYGWNMETSTGRFSFNIGMSH